MGFWETLGVATITAMLAWVGFAVNAHLLRQAEKDKALQAEKRATYKRLMETLFNALSIAKAIDKQEVIKDLELEFSVLIREMTVYASDDVFKKWIQFKTVGKDPAPEELLAIVGSLILSVRRDLGHDSVGVTTRDVLATFVNDIESVNLPSVDQ
ncbi:MAG: hypothetical protein AAF790_01040 [Planctomycetota bacterium]